MNRAKVVGITWPIPPEISDAELDWRPFTAAGFHEGPISGCPTGTKVHEELKRRGVTLMILGRSIAPSMSTATDIPASASFTANVSKAALADDAADVRGKGATSCSSTGLVAGRRSSIR